MRQLSNSGAISEARRFKTLMLGRSVGSGAGAVALPQATAQNQIIIANATPAWTLLTAPTAEGQVLVTGADPYTPAWGTTFPAVIQFDAGIIFGGGTGINTLTIPDGATEAISIADAGGTEYLRIGTTSPNVTINEDGEDIDFVVEAVGMSVALIVQGSNGWVGIHYVPEVPFHVHPAAQFDAGITFGGATSANDLTVPDNVAQAVHLVDAGGIEYLRIVSTDAQPVVVFNEGGADVDHRWEASGQENALFIQGSNGFIALGHDAPEKMLHIKSSTAGYSNIILEQYSNDTNSPDVQHRKGRGTIASPLDVAVDDNLGQWYFSGYRNSDWRSAAQIGGTVNALGTSVVRGGLSFSTTNAAGTLVVQMTIDEDGNVHVLENSAMVRLSGTFCWRFVIPEPTVETVGQIRIPWDCTVTRVDGNVQGGTSCTFNIEERGTLGSAGTNVLSSDMAADANGESVTSSFNNSSLAEGNHLAYDVSAVSGAVDYISIAITGTIN